MDNYEAPEIVETFSALDVMGCDEGLEVYIAGCGSTVCARISLPA